MVGNDRAAKFNRANVKAESPIVRKTEGPVVGLLFSRSHLYLFSAKIMAILIVLLVLCTFWKAKRFAHWIGAAAATRLCWLMAWIWGSSFLSLWLILLISQFAGNTLYWPQPWKSAVSIVYGLTCILPLPVLSLAPYTK
jgi:hypothetical protein